MPKKDGYIFALRNNELNVLSLDRMKIAAACGFEGQIRRICASSNECECYILDAEYRLYQCVWRGNSLDVKYCCSDFSLNSRGFFTLPESGCVVGLSDESYVCYDGRELIQGTLPSLLDGAGPAVSVEKDVFYFAGKTLKEYSIKAVCRE